MGQKSSCLQANLPQDFPPALSSKSMHCQETVTPTKLSLKQKIHKIFRLPKSHRKTASLDPACTTTAQDENSVKPAYKHSISPLKLDEMGKWVPAQKSMSNILSEKSNLSKRQKSMLAEVGISPLNISRSQSPQRNPSKRPPSFMIESHRHSKSLMTESKGESLVCISPKKSQDLYHNNPLVRPSKSSKKLPFLSRSDQMVESFSDYLQSQKSKNPNPIKPNRTVTKSQSMALKKPESFHQEIRDCEFELSTIRDCKEQKLPINDFHETMDYYRGQKDHQNFIASLTQDSKYAPLKLFKPNSQAQKRRGFFANSQDFDQTSQELLSVPTNPALSPLSSMGKLPCKSRNCLLQSVILRSSPTQSPKLKALIPSEANFSIIEENKARVLFQRGLVTPSPSRSCKERPLSVIKNNKNLIFFKNRVIEIEEQRNRPNNEKIESKQEMLVKILKEGSTPTKFFMKGGKAT